MIVLKVTIFANYCLLACCKINEMSVITKNEMNYFCFLLTGVVVYEYELKIGWGKSVALPSQALPAPPPGHMAIRSKEVC